MVYDPTGNNKNDGNDQGGQRPNKSNYNKNGGGYNNKNNNDSRNNAPRNNNNNNNNDKKSSVVAAAWKRDDGAILVKFNGDEENGIPAFDMFLNESKFADGTKPDYVAFRTSEPGGGKKSKENNGR